MGDYATPTPTETFMQKTGEQATNDIAMLKGARLVSAMESDDHGRLVESVIKRLTEKLVKEMPGILSWMIEGDLRWQKEGLGSAVAEDEATDEYRNQMSDIQMFLADKCQRDENEIIQSSLLYGEYTAWCEVNHERPKSNRNFSMMLSDSGMDKERLSPGIFW